MSSVNPKMHQTLIRQAPQLLVRGIPDLRVPRALPGHGTLGGQGAIGVPRVLQVLPARGALLSHPARLVRAAPPSVLRVRKVHTLDSNTRHLAAPVPLLRLMLPACFPRVPGGAIWATRHWSSRPFVR